jgi:putative salt-induced outer membrane protein
MTANAESHRSKDTTHMDSITKHCGLGTLAVLGFTSLTSVARAEDIPKGLLAGKTATAGATDVATSGFEKKEAPVDDKNTTAMQLSAGALSSSGNAKTLSLTAAGRFKARRQDNQLSLSLAGNYAESAPKPDQDRQTTMKNLQGKTRYDRFLGHGFAVFMSLSARSDRFQGLVLRTNLDPGLSYYFVDQGKQQLWTEIGYDYQWDLRRYDTIQKAAESGVALSKSDSRHAARLFLGYEGSINEIVGITTGLEYLQSVEESKYWRLNWDLGLTSALSSKFSLSTTFNLRYDNAPLPSIKNTDTITAVNLVYQLL